MRPDGLVDACGRNPTSSSASQIMCMHVAYLIFHPNRPTPLPLPTHCHLTSRGTRAMVRAMPERGLRRRARRHPHETTPNAVKTRLLRLRRPHRGGRSRQRWRAAQACTRRREGRRSAAAGLCRLLAAARAVGQRLSRLQTSPAKVNGPFVISLGMAAVTVLGPRRGARLSSLLGFRTRSHISRCMF